MRTIRRRWRDVTIAALLGAVIMLAIDPRPQASYGLAIKQIQCGDIAVNNGSATGTSTLASAVVVAKSFPIFLGFSGVTPSAGSEFNHHIRIGLTNTTTVTGTRIGTTENSTAGYCVMEFY